LKQKFNYCNQINHQHPPVKVLFDVEMIAEMMKNLLQVHTGATGYTGVMGHTGATLVMKNHDSHCLVSIRLFHMMDHHYRNRSILKNN